MNRNFCYEIQMLPQMISNDETFPAFATDQSLGHFSSILSNQQLQQQLFTQIGDSRNLIHFKSIQFSFNKNNQNREFFIFQSSQYKKLIDEFSDVFTSQYEEFIQNQKDENFIEFVNNPLIYQSSMKLQEFKNQIFNLMKNYLKPYKNVIQIQPSNEDRLIFYTDNQNYKFNVSLNDLKPEMRIQKVCEYIKLYKQKKDILSLVDGEKLIVAQLLDGYSKIRLEKLLVDIQYCGCPIYYLRDKIDKQTRDKIQQQIPGTDFYILYYKQPKVDNIAQYIAGDRYRTDDYYTKLDYQLSDEEFDKMNQIQIKRLQKIIQKLNKVKPTKNTDYLHVSVAYKELSSVKKILVVVNFWLIIFGSIKVSEQIYKTYQQKNQKLIQ